MERRAAWQSEGKDWPHHAASRFVSAAGIDWHVQSFGSGPSLLLIHGTGASTHSWADIIPILQKTFAVTAFDLPGHGFTQQVESRRMRLPAVAQAVGELIKALNISPITVVGHSAGAAIAARMALDGYLPYARVIIGVNAALLPFRGFAGWIGKPLARILASGSLVANFLSLRARREGAVERVIASTGSSSTPQSLAIYKRLMQMPGHVKATLDMMANWDLDTLEGDLPRLAVPLVLIACGEDTAVTPEVAFAVRDLLPGTIVHFERKLAHLAHEVAPEQIAEIIRKHAGLA